jgi:DNA-binding NarL/FixJ family response regulator
MTAMGKRLVRVLIADKHTLARAEIHRVIDGDTRFGVCAEAVDAAGAVQAALRHGPDLCVVEPRMPGGLAAIWEIRARRPDVKVVVLTVSDEDADLFAALRAGVDGYLLKTMDLDRLPEALNGVCSGEAAIPRILVSRLLECFRQREPRWRRPTAGTAQQRLTSREWEVLDLLAQDRSTCEIAERLVISPSAVRAYVASIVRKLQVPSRAAAVELFRRQPDT